MKCVILAMLLGLTISPAYANVMTAADIGRVQAVWGKAERLADDIKDTTVSILMQAAQSPSLTLNKIPDIDDDVNCMMQLRVGTDFLESGLRASWVALVISSTMTERGDEISALTMAKTSLELISKQLQTLRRAASGTAGICSHSAAVNVKAQALLDLMTDVGEIILPLQQKIGAVAP